MDHSNITQLSRKDSGLAALFLRTATLLWQNLKQLRLPQERLVSGANMTHFTVASPWYAPPDFLDEVKRLTLGIDFGRPALDVLC
jgi:hypothetical protein